MLRSQPFGALVATLAVVATAAAGTAALAGETLNGAGGTAIYPVLAKWAVSYQKQTGVSVNYQAIGSGGGIRQITHKTVPFANSDMPLTPAKLAAQGLVQFPAVIIGITPVVHLPGVNAGQLFLDGPTLADIYLGTITRWNDARIEKLNPKVKLPATRITVVHRADGSGTTFNFTNYLSKVSPAWRSKVGSNTAVQWPVGIGGKGNAGVASYVQQVKGAIGYVEYAYTLKTHLTYTRMVNQAGHQVTPEMKSFQAAAANADFTKTQDFYLILTDQPGAESWPITAATYILMRKDTAKAENQKVLHFCKLFLTHGQRQAEKLDYVPLPKKTVAQIEHYWKGELGMTPGA